MDIQLHDDEILSYIRHNPVMILGTVDAGHKPHGAPVFVCATNARQLYFVTKTETQKYKNILHNHAVSVTILDANENSALQAGGTAATIDDPQIIELVMSKMAKIYAQSADWLPPLAKLRAGAYQVVGIKIEYARLAHFKGVHAGSSHIFKEL